MDGKGASSAATIAPASVETLTNQLQKGLDVLGDESPHKPLFRTCRSCNQAFNVKTNSETSCRYHPESFCGETAQRWMAPGETEGAGTVHNFYSCCGGKERSAPGCCSTYHKTFDEAENEWGRRPGMGIQGAGIFGP